MALYTSEQAAILEKGAVRPSILFRMVLTDNAVVRLWAGFGDLTIDTDNIEDDASNIYYGAGELVDLPVFEALLNGDADRVEFVLSGAAVTSEVVNLSDAESELVRRARVNVGLVMFDEDWQIALPVKWIWEGLADSLSPASSGSSGERLNTLRLSVGSALTGRRRPSPAYYTDLSQQARSSGDTFCERVNLYRQEQPKPWPRA